MYIRKTHDEYTIWANYGYGWEDIVTYDNYKEAKEDLRAYRENEKDASFYIKKHMVRNEG